MATLSPYDTVKLVDRIFNDPPSPAGSLDTATTARTIRAHEDGAVSFG
jgi:hypothetical protein